MCGALLLSNVQLLEQQFSDASLDIIGVQEGRSAVSQHRRGHSYHMLISAADQHGALGVQLWIRYGISIEAWLSLGPRLLYAVVRKSTMFSGFIVAHAPIEHADKHDKDSWWELLHVSLYNLKVKYAIPWSVLIDANGRTR